MVTRRGNILPAPLESSPTHSGLGYLPRPWPWLCLERCSKRRMPTDVHSNAHSRLASRWYLFLWGKVNPLFNSLFLISVLWDEESRNTGAGSPRVSLGPLPCLSSQPSSTTWSDSSCLIGDASFSSSTMNLSNSDCQVGLNLAVRILQVSRSSAHSPFTEPAVTSSPHRYGFSPSPSSLSPLGQSDPLNLSPGPQINRPFWLNL